MFGAHPKEYELRSEMSICCGGLATVYLAIHKPLGKKVAVKKFRLDVAEEYNLIEQEVLITRQLQHPNVLPYLASFIDDLELVVVSPFMVYGSCRDIMVKYFNTGLPEIAVAFVLRDILCGLEYIHSKGYIHRSIRASHMLVDITGRVVLSGLRGAGHLMSGGQRQRNLHALPPFSTQSLNWFSPEVLEQNIVGYNEKSDIYSLAIAACELANGNEPFADMPITLMLTEKLRGYPPPQLLDCTTCTETQGNTSVVGDTNSHSSRYRRKFSDTFHNFVELCGLRDPSARPPASSLLTHSFFKLCRQSDLFLEFLKHVPPADAKLKDQRASILAEELAQLNVKSSCEWTF